MSGESICVQQILLVVSVRFNSLIWIYHKIVNTTFMSDVWVSTVRVCLIDAACKSIYSSVYSCII